MAMELKSLRGLYVDELRDLLSAERQLVRALPKMARAANSQDLKQAFDEHLQQTKGHVDRLEQIFQGLDMSARAKTCKGMEGLITEGQQLMEEESDPAVLDAGLIAAAQKVEHYEIASYGTARTYANVLGFKDQANLLQQTLTEEETTDKKLTKLAESGINVEAATAGGNGRSGR